MLNPHTNDRNGDAGKASLDRKKRRLQFTSRWLLLVTVLAAVSLSLFRPRLVRFRVTLIGASVVARSDIDGTAKVASIRIENAGGNTVWWVQPAAHMNLHLLTARGWDSVEYDIRGAAVTRFQSGAVYEFEVPVDSDVTHICLGLRVVDRRFGSTKMYWSGMLSLDGRIPSETTLHARALEEVDFRATGGGPDRP
jgi:hypothetical protein